MKHMEIPFETVIGRKMLLIGDVRTGKTLATARLLDALLGYVKPEEITLIDLAPSGEGGIGRRVEEYTSSVQRIRLLKPARLNTPRLTGRTAEEVLKLAEENIGVIEPVLREYLESPTEVLLVNDLSMALHAEPPPLVHECIRSCSTFIGNSYYGRRLADDRGSGLSDLERRNLENLLCLIDIVVDMNSAEISVGLDGVEIRVRAVGRHS